MNGFKFCLLALSASPKSKDRWCLQFLGGGGGVVSYLKSTVIIESSCEPTPSQHREALHSMLIVTSELSSGAALHRAHYSSLYCQGMDH